MPIEAWLELRDFLVKFQAKWNTSEVGAFLFDLEIKMGDPPVPNKEVEK